MKKLLLLSAILFLALAVFIFWPRTTKPFPDADLQVVRATLSENENAFSLLTQATNEADFSDETVSIISELNKSKTWDSNRVSEVLSEYEKALDLFEKALELRLQVPEIKSFDEEYPYLSSWKTLATLASLKCKALFRGGNEKEAFDSAIQIVRFGHQIEQCDGTLTHYLVGSAVKRIGFKVIQELTGSTTMSTDDLLIFLKKLSPYSANQTALTNVIKMEYQIQIAGVEQMRTGNYPGTTNTELQKTAFRFMQRPFFNEEETKTICATFARNQLRSIPKARNMMPANLNPTLGPSKMKLLLSGNAMGNILMQMTFPSAEKFLSRKCRENVDLAATQIILALRCHQMKTGVLPRSLDELVPEFLSAVPLDDFDGKPMRFSADKRVVYSVGEDLIDSDGQEKDAKGKSLDIPFVIEF